MILDFSSIDFHPATADERIRKCRAMAEEAMMLASGSLETRETIYDWRNAGPRSVMSSKAR
jgi:hypothetical protein